MKTAETDRYERIMAEDDRNFSIFMFLPLSMVLALFVCMANTLESHPAIGAVGIGMVLLLILAEILFLSYSLRKLWKIKKKDKLKRSKDLKDVLQS